MGNLLKIFSISLSLIKKCSPDLLGVSGIALALFIELRDYLELHHDNSIINMLKLVKNTVNVLESDESEDFKSEYVLESYKTLYTGRAGLTEYWYAK